MINVKKSEMVPTQDLVYVGSRFRIDLSYLVVTLLSCSSKIGGTIPTWSNGHGTCIPATTRHHGQYTRYHFMGQVSHVSASSMLEADTCETWQQGVDQPCNRIPMSRDLSPHLVDKEAEHIQGHVPDTSTARCHHRYGRVQSRLESTYRRLF